MTKIAFVTNLCSHYRVKTFETLASLENVDYFFFSAGNEWYWDHTHGISHGRFRHVYLRGVQIGKTRIAFTLPARLMAGKYDLYLKCINGKFALPVTYFIARLRGKPFVLWTGIWMRLQTPLHRLLWPFTRHVYRHADAIVTYGEHVKRYLISEGVPAERIFPAHHAVDNAAYDRVVPAAEQQALRAQLNLQPDHQVVLFVGRLVPVKGLDDLLRAFAQLDAPNAVLVLVGHGPLETHLAELAAELGISDRVRFAGYVPTSQTTAYYAIASVLALPSVTTASERETWGLVVNEAFNQGLPVVASDAVGAAAGGLVLDGHTGFVVPERDITTLRDRLQAVLRDPDLRQRLSHGARERIAQWTNDAMVADFRAAIHHAVRTHAARHHHAHPAGQPHSPDHSALEIHE